MKSIFFDDTDIISAGSADSVKFDAFMSKVKGLCAYNKEFTKDTVVDLKKAEDILLYVRNLYK